MRSVIQQHLIVIAKGKGKNAELIIEKAKKLNIGNMQSPI